MNQLLKTLGETLSALADAAKEAAEMPVPNSPESASVGTVEPLQSEMLYARTGTLAQMFDMSHGSMNIRMAEARRENAVRFLVGEGGKNYRYNVNDVRRYLESKYGRGAA